MEARDCRRRISNVSMVAGTLSCSSRIRLVTGRDAPSTGRQQFGMQESEYYQSN